MGQPEVEVTVDVDPPDTTPPDGGDTTVVVTPPAPNNDAGDLVAIVVGHGERITALEAAVTALAPAVVEAEATAEVALDQVEQVAAETEEAVATLAEEADAATDEVRAEVEDIAPDRSHPWFAGRSMLRRGGDER